MRERFEAKIDTSGPDDHWLWTGAITKNGYGKIGVGGKRGGWQLAHRVAWTLYRGVIPDGLQLDHLCRVRHCVNPDHLEPVTVRTNLLRGDTLTAKYAAKTHCPQDHEYTPENTRYNKRGWRTCRTCERERDRQRWPRRREVQNRLRAQRYHASKSPDRE